MTRNDQHHTPVEATLLRHTTCRTLTPNSKHSQQQMLPHKAGLPSRNHRADGASAYFKLKTDSSPRCPTCKPNGSKILKTP